MLNHIGALIPITLVFLFFYKWRYLVIKSKIDAIIDEVDTDSAVREAQSIINSK